VGNTTNKKSSKKEDTKNKIESDSLLGQMLKFGSDNLQTKGIKKQQMTKYNCFIWTQGPILEPTVFWSKFGSNEG
jgi:hypothetical protein